MALPAVIEPCLPSPGEQPPTGPGWVHEIKHDGYRLMARRDPVSVGIRLLTRNGHQGRGSMVFELSPEDGKAADPSAGRSFIIRPFPLTGTTKIPARNDRTRAVPPKCAG
jgi:hypothetical protein